MLTWPVFPGHNIYRAANLLIWCHCDSANLEATRIADTMRDFGDLDERAFWMKVEQAIIEPATQPAIRPTTRRTEYDPHEGLSWR
jgi:hypothetical protein